jgi:hypothetical protein
VRQERVPFPLRQPGQRLHDGGLLLPGHEAVVVGLLGQQVDDAVLVAPVPVALAPQ